MAWLEITGGRPLEGKTAVQGSKNAALPILAGVLLQKGITILHHCPRIADVEYMLQILEKLGSVVRWEGSTLVIDTSGAVGTEVPLDLGEKMRSSVILLGSLLARNGRAKIPYPGGCTIGKRPIDLHMRALKTMGAYFESGEEYLLAKAEKLIGRRVAIPFPSVGATENILLAAVLAEGETVLTGAAMEPEIVELCHFLRGKGARIKGEGTPTLVVEGVRELHDSVYTLGADRIVAGTYLFGAALTRGKIFLEGAPTDQMEAVLQALNAMGAVWRAEEKGLYLDGSRAHNPLSGLKTQPYPGFPTDLQSQLLAALSLAEGESEVEETIFEARFHVVRQLRRMGADITIDGRKAHVRGVTALHGTFVKAEELRGGAALVLAALGAEGTTIIQDDGYIGRGYEDLTRDLRYLNASIHSENHGG